MRGRRVEVGVKDVSVDVDVDMALRERTAVCRLSGQ